VTLGVTLTATADSYGPEVSERLIAQAMDPYPDELVIVTKAAWCGPGRGDGNPAGACIGPVQAGGHDVLIIGGRQTEVLEFLWFLPQELRVRVAGTFTADPATTSLAEIRGNAGFILKRYQRGQGERLISSARGKAAASRPAALGLENCRWAASTSAIQTLLVRDCTVASGVVCENDRAVTIAACRPSALAGSVSPVVLRPASARPGPGRQAKFTR
jgi:hypothetical protein